MIVKDKFGTLHVLLLMLYLGGLATFLVVRLNGLWGENDMSVLAEIIQSMLNSAELVPSDAYSQGYGYPVIATFLIRATGVSTAQFQMLLVPLLSVWLVLPAWLFYRELLRNERMASLATALLLIQPELLFVVLRSSHEKFTRGLMLLGYYILLRSLRSRNRLTTFGGLVLGFYMVCYSLITVNNLIANSYIVGTGIAVGLMLLIHRFVDDSSRVSPHLFRRLIYVLGSMFLIAFIFTYYLYEPASISLSLYSTATERVSVLVLNIISLGSRTNAVNPYQVVVTNWPSTSVYLLLSGANWVMLVSSALLWAYTTYQLFRKQIVLSQLQWLLWSLYAAYAGLTAAAIAIDASGFLGANLQLRIFPAFGMLAAPMIAQFIQLPPHWKPVKKRAFATLSGALLTIVCVLSIIKATNEPTVSNNWIFATTQEVRALDWIREHGLRGELWTDYNERLNKIYKLLNVANPRSSNVRFTYQAPLAANIVVSDLVRLRSERFNRPLPGNLDDLHVYDNGTTDVYHRRPKTAYEQ